MPATAEQLNFYQLGVRLFQAIFLLENDPGGEAFAVSQHAALIRVIGVLNVFRAAGLTDGFSASGWREIIESNCRLLQQPKLPSERQRLSFEIRLSLENIRLAIEDFLRVSNSDNLPWYQLGLSIVDGFDHTYSEGTPSLETTPAGRHVRLVFTKPCPPNWVWRNEQRVLSLIERLQLNRNRLFVGETATRCSRTEQAEFIAYKHMETLFPDVPYRSLWGWGSVEQGIAYLQPVAFMPRWDPVERALYVEGQQVRRLLNRGENQVAVIEAFHAESWAPIVDCPANVEHKLGATLRDLNKAIFPRLVRFEATGDGHIRWRHTPRNRKARK